nr:probable carbohydrate esterase At4g34215 [Ipomoea trifida]GME07710.1 probable carbohydrate esterase At4g34215 [Ipomoea batatas]
MLSRTYAALRDGRGQIRAHLWYQGEREANGKSYPSPFASNLEIFFKSVRNDLGLPTLPIIQVAFVAQQQIVLMLRILGSSVLTETSFAEYRRCQWITATK